MRAGVLPAVLCAPGGTRTPSLLIRSPTPTDGVRCHVSTGERPPQLPELSAVGMDGLRPRSSLRLSRPERLRRAVSAVGGPDQSSTVGAGSSREGTHAPPRGLGIRGSRERLTLTAEPVGSPRAILYADRLERKRLIPGAQKMARKAGPRNS
jgi:hypothetical protein